MDAGPLKWLVAPIPPRQFFSRYWERRPLHVVRRQPGYYSDLFELADLDAIVTGPRHDPSRSTLLLVQDGRRVTPDEIASAREKDRIDVVEVNRRLASGSTLVLNGIESMVRPLGELVTRLSRAMTARVWTNLYYTPTQSRGFSAHYDVHDVFILQVHGSKHWKLHGRPVGIPHPKRVVDAASIGRSPVSKRLTLRRGDVLYIPKGLVHSAASAREPSVHLTLAIESLTWADLLAEVCAKEVDRNERLRRGLPAGFGLPGADRRRMAQTLASVVRGMSRRLGVPAALDELHDRIARGSAETMPGLVEQTLRRDALGPMSIVGVRPGLHYRLTSGRSHFTVRCYGNEISIPTEYAPLLRFALSHDRFAVRELPGRVDTSVKLEFVRELVAEGVLRVLAFEPNAERSGPGRHPSSSSTENARANAMAMSSSPVKSSRSS